VKKILLIAFLLFCSIQTYSQVKDYALGTSNPNNLERTGGFYDYSDPLGINIKVGIWGFVRFPGRYIVPENITVTDLLSYAGGPTDDAHLEDLRIYRTDDDANQEMIKFTFNDLMWEDRLSGIRSDVPDLRASDILVVPGSPRLYFKDWFSIALSIFSALISLAILIININK
jgi:polysaccharide export outer membrane protein